MSTISIACNDQVLSFTNMPVIASGDVNNDQVQFTFCSTWSGFSRMAVFYQESGHYFFSILDGDDKCTIPYEAISKEGITNIGVVGVNGDTKKTSNILRYEIVQGAYSEVQDPSPDIYQQVLELATQISNDIDEFEDEFDQMAYVQMRDANTFQYDTPEFDAEVLKVVDEVFQAGVMRHDFTIDSIAGNGTWTRVLIEVSVLWGDNPAVVVTPVGDLTTASDITVSYFIAPETPHKELHLSVKNNTGSAITNLKLNVLII